MIDLIYNYNYDSRYNSIKLFASKQAQITYFNQRVWEHIDNNKRYTRETETAVIVAYNKMQLMEANVNYLVINNGTRDYYYFINEKQYVNAQATRLIIQLDVLQTFQFDIDLGNSFCTRKVCSLGELTEFDEGIEMGEHVAEYDKKVLNKAENYYAMFGGIKQQEVVMGDSGQVIDVIDLPAPTQKPSTMIQGIQYPLYFMPLQNTYPTPVINHISPSVTSNIIESAKKLIGKPYVWGGNYPPLGQDEGTDCSGLCQWAYDDSKMIDLVDITGRWTTHSWSMWGAGKEITITEAIAGDPIFTSFDEDGEPQHVFLFKSYDRVTNKVTVIEAQQTGTLINEYTKTFNSTTMKVRRLYE